MTKSTAKVSVVIPSWNAKEDLKACLDSLLQQSLKHRIIVVENGSVDGSVEFLQTAYPQVDLIIHEVNKGFAGGVNAGIRRSIEQGDDYVALFNNDAIADTEWLQNLMSVAESSDTVGIVTCKLMDIEGKRLDSTGDMFTNWGLPYPRGRGEPVSDKYDTQTEIFGASGGASLYRIAMLQEIGLFDEDFFAYYEDVDISFRAQLMGWKVRYAPEAVAYHQIGATSSKIRGFTTYQTMKNLPLIVYKNVPRKYLWHVGWRSLVARTLFFGRAILRRQGWHAFKGDLMASYLILKKSRERTKIQSTKKVSDEYIWNILDQNLPPNAVALRKLRWIFKK
jgi:GT2 family glycosyltransferase